MARVGKAVKGGAKSRKIPGGKKGGIASLRLEVEAYKDGTQFRDEAWFKSWYPQIKEKLLVEERHAKINRLKIQNQWRKIMRLAKAEDLRKDIEIHSQNHEREVDRKDAIIQMYDRDLDDAEEQYQMALRSHLENVDRLIALQEARVRALDEEFEKDLRMREEEFGNERDEIIGQHAAEKKEMEDIMAAMEAEYNEQEQEMRQEFESQREEIKNKNQEEYNVLRITLESTIEELEKHFESAHQTYVANTEQRAAEFKRLTKRDFESAKTIDQQMRKMQRLHDLLQHWKMKTANNVSECDHRNNHLQQEKDAIALHFQELKAKMNRFRDVEAKRLTDLTNASRACIKVLNKNLAAAERLLRLAELNRKLETEREKVLPFYKSSVDEEDAQLASLQADVELMRVSAASSRQPADDNLSATQKHLSPDAKDTSRKNVALHGSELRVHAYATDDKGRVVDEANYLINFLKRFNKVLLDKIAMEREKERLMKENDDLRAILKQYLDGISVNEDVLNQMNPLLVVNSKISLNIPPSARPPPPTTIIEGNHEVVFQHVRC